MAIPKAMPETPTEMSGFEVHSVGFTSDPEELRRVMWIVIDKMYDNPTKSLFREYISNSIDSHIRAGQTRPVEITLPTDLEPYLTLRDWGTGMSRNFLTEVYTKLGKSDKVESVNEAGQFGMGAKVVYGHLRAINKEQALITSVQNGIKTEGVVLLNEGCVPDLALLDSVETDEPNGCVFRVPTNAAEIYSDANYIQQLANYSQDILITNPISVNNTPKVIRTVQTDRYLLEYIQVKNAENKAHAGLKIDGRVVINGMPYKYPLFIDETFKFNRFDSGLNYFRFIAKFGPNDLEYTASRDAIRAESSDKITAVLKEATEHFRALVQHELDSCDTALHAQQWLNLEYGLLSFNNFQWRERVYQTNSKSSSSFDKLFPVELETPSSNLSFLFLAGSANPTYVYTHFQDSDILNGVTNKDGIKQFCLSGASGKFAKVSKKANVALEFMERYPVVVMNQADRLGKQIAKDLNIEGSFFVVKLPSLETIPEYLQILPTLLVYAPEKVERVKSNKEIDLEKKILSMSRSVKGVFGRDGWASILKQNEVSVIELHEDYSRARQTLFEHWSKFTYSVSSLLYSYMMDYNSNVRMKFYAPTNLIKLYFKQDCFFYTGLEMFAYFGVDPGWLKNILKETKRDDLVCSLDQYRIYVNFVSPEFQALKWSQESEYKLKFEEILNQYLPQDLIKALRGNKNPLNIPVRDDSRYLGKDQIIGDWQDDRVVKSYMNGESQHGQIGRYVIARWLGLDPINALWAALPGANIYQVSDRVKALGITSSPTPP